MNDDLNLHEACEAYVVGALDASESALFERHLQTCASCRAEITSYSAVNAALESIAIPPPPAIPRLPVKYRVRPRLAAYAALAAAVVGIVGGIGVPRYEHERATEQTYAEIARMLATDPIEVALVGANGVTGRAIVGEAHQRTGFVVRGLPEASAGFVYRVWVRGRSLRRSPGILEMTSDGLHVLVTPGDALERASSIRIMLEPISSADRTVRRMMLAGTIG